MLFEAALDVAMDASSVSEAVRAAGKYLPEGDLGGIEVVEVPCERLETGA